jgi:Raf kinase inhibitor-like YbhB/YbcL family protein
MRITSPAFEHGQSIPERYSKDGGNEIPPLQFEGVPENAQSLVLIVDDPDAPRGTFTHWIAFNIPARLRQLDASKLPEGIRQGLNDWDEAAYGGPQPPDREHRYFFRLYALDTVLKVVNGATRREVELAMERHVLTNAELMGRFAPSGAAVSG